MSTVGLRSNENKVDNSHNRCWEVMPDCKEAKGPGKPVAKASIRIKGELEPWGTLSQCVDVNRGAWLLLEKDSLGLPAAIYDDKDQVLREILHANLEKLIRPPAAIPSMSPHILSRFRLIPFRTIDVPSLYPSIMHGYNLQPSPVPSPSTMIDLD
jgi:hypothetical protein